MPPPLQDDDRDAVVGPVDVAVEPQFRAEADRDARILVEDGPALSLDERLDFPPAVQPQQVGAHFSAQDAAFAGRRIADWPIGKIRPSGCLAPRRPCP